MLRPILSQIDLLQATLKDLYPIKTEFKKKLDKKFRMEFNFNSNHIEGNTLTYSETELYLIFGRTQGQHQVWEYDQMRAHNVAYNLIVDWSNDPDHNLTEVDIRNLNEIILVTPFWKEALTINGEPTKREISIGVYKTFPNYVRLRNGEIFEYTSPEETPIQMGELMVWYRNELDTNRISILELAANFHYKFVRIHPFDDGNGRIARLLMNYILLRHGYPPIIIKTSDKDNYLFALNEADTGNITAYLKYIAQQLIWSLNLSIRATKTGNVDEPGDLDKKMAILKSKSGDMPKSIDIKYSLSSVIRAIEYDLKELLDYWEIKLKEFDTFFFSRQNTVNIKGTDQTVRKQGNDLYEVFVEACKDYFKVPNIDPEQIPINVQTEVSEITLTSQFKRLRQLSENTSYNGGEIRILFHDNVYEILSTGSSRNITKLYSEDLTALERTEVIEGIGNFIVSYIEEALS